MPTNTDSAHAILTTIGADNVTAAGMFLLVSPDANLQIRRMSRLPDDLARLRQTRPPQTTPHLCGIGVDDRLHEICRERRRLQEAGCDGNWTRATQKLEVAVNTLRKWVDAGAS